MILIAMGVSGCGKTTIGEIALQPLGQHLANGGLATTRYTHHDQYHLTLLTRPSPARKSVLNPSPK